MGVPGGSGAVSTSRAQFEHTRAVHFNVQLTSCEETYMGSPVRSYKHPQRMLLRYKRNYMREWRARPENFNRERGNRQRAYAHQKLLRNEQSRSATVRILPLASIGGKIIRLRPLAHGFAEMLVPYCGQC